MSQEQPHRPAEAVKYGDIFQVSGDLADEPIKPQHAAESCVFRRNQKYLPATAMQAAAAINERTVQDKGVTVTAIDYPGDRIITESVAGEIVGQYYEEAARTDSGEELTQITIGEALLLTMQIAGNKPVDKNDADAILAAEARATGRNVMIPGGISAAAQSAAAFNAAVTCEDDKIKLSSVLVGATGRLWRDKAATREDAEEVVTAELKNNPNSIIHPGGVGSSLAAAARMNEGKTDSP